MRLTDKVGIDYIYSNFVSLNEPHKSVANKLGQLEDIEEELGIDLITLFKALKNGIWFRNVVDNKIRCSIPMCAELELSEKGLSLISMEMDILFFFKDYGKTWSLDKKDLTKEK